MSATLCSITGHVTALTTEIGDLMQPNLLAQFNSILSSTHVDSEGAMSIARAGNCTCIIHEIA